MATIMTGPQLTQEIFFRPAASAKVLISAHLQYEYLRCRVSSLCLQLQILLFSLFPVKFDSRTPLPTFSEHSLKAALTLAKSLCSQPSHKGLTLIVRSLFLTFIFLRKVSGSMPAVVHWPASYSHSGTAQNC